MREYHSPSGRRWLSVRMSPWSMVIVAGAVLLGLSSTMGWLDDDDEDSNSDGLRWPKHQKQWARSAFPATPPPPAAANDAAAAAAAAAANVRSDSISTGTSSESSGTTAAASPRFSSLDVSRAAIATRSPSVSITAPPDEKKDERATGSSQQERQKQHRPLGLVGVPSDFDPTNSSLRFCPAAKTRGFETDKRETDTVAILLSGPYRATNWSVRSFKDQVVDSLRSEGFKVTVFVTTEDVANYTVHTQFTGYNHWSSSKKQKNIKAQTDA
uniref:Uncharacterized protein n=1 Tax=Lotharella oceanica TaxID=641309 RepID=A0A7S2TR43_9EUKA|mmetsp:Transcript_24276/g.45421  ORF Transcript_24276/g.45421 Transcript_24276/m.45421 type:complete len:270 (+) Transcript_24276:96-905(+)